MSKITLRYYQQDAINSIFTHYQDGHMGNPLVVMPTGTGKSVVIASFCETVAKNWPDQRIMVLTHSKELIEQNYAKFCQLYDGPNQPGIFSASVGRKDVLNNIIFAGIQSVSRNPIMFGKIDIVIVDEAHMISPKQNTQYQKFFDGIKSINPRCIVIGLTATPYRMGQGYITDPVHIKGKGEFPPTFSRICYDLSELKKFNSLIQQGYLANLTTKATNTYLDIDNVDKVGGEFVASQLQDAVDRDAVTKSAIAECMEIAGDRNKWLVFSSGVRHAKHICEELNLNGISAKCITGEMCMQDRNQVLAEFKDGRIRCVVNYAVLTTGFDAPDIDFIAILRATASVGLWQQMVGRGLRPYPGKRDCLIADFGRNCERLGPVNNPIPPRASGKGKGVGKAPVKTCPHCNTINHASARVCVGYFPNGAHCKYEFPIINKVKSHASTAEIVDTGLPIVEIFDVNSVSYLIKNKPGKPPYVQVSYYCGLRRFREFLTPQHSKQGEGNARRWWRDRTDLPEPMMNAVELVAAAEKLPVPRNVRVWTNLQYPRVLAVNVSRETG